MAESAKHPAGAAESGGMLNIPWILRWEERRGESRRSFRANEKLASILSDLEYRTMLEELEYR